MSHIANITIPPMLDPSVLGLDVKRSVVQIVLEISVLAVVWCLSILGNTLVCVVIHRSRRMQSTTNYFVVSLACADITLSIVSLPFIASRITVNSWLVGTALCKIVRFVQYLVPCINMYVLISICIDRFYTIIYPLSFKVTRGTAKRLIAFSWIFSFILCSFNFYFFEVFPSVTRSNTELCSTYIPVLNWSGIVYTICVVFVCQFLIPSTILLVGYTRIFKFIWTAEFAARPIHRTMNPVPRAKVKMVKMLMVATYSTLVSYTPFYIVQLWFCFNQEAFREPTIFIAVTILVVCTTVTKPLIYLYFNTNFRRGCKEVFCMSTMKCYRSHTYTITNASSMGKKNHIGIVDSNDTSERSACTPDPSCQAFNRAMQVEKSMWPLNGTMSSTCM